MQSSLVNNRTGEQGLTRPNMSHGQAFEPIPARVKETLDPYSIVAWPGGRRFILHA
jgi:hypothetical protein